MKKEESIKEIFKEKEFSDEALYYLENAINEFEEVFGQYVSREELIERIKRNINSIEFVDKIDYKRENKCCLGLYSLQDKKIQVLSTLDDEKKKSVFFHEFLHAEASFDERTGFAGEYQDLL